MTKLEEEIEKAISEVDWQFVRLHRRNSCTDDAMPENAEAKAAAEVAKKYISKAITDLAGFVVTNEEYAEWLKENGITE